MAISVTIPVTLLNTTLWLGPVATKENQTSSLTPVAPHVGAGTPVVCVAETVVPFIVCAQEKFALTGTGVAPAQLSLAGGGGGIETQIPNVPNTGGVAVALYLQNLIRIVLPGTRPVLLI